MAATWLAAAAWSAFSGTEPSCTWSARSAVAEAFSRFHSGWSAVIVAGAVVAVIVIFGVAFLVA
jgi:hypothetical protein